MTTNNKTLTSVALLLVIAFATVAFCKSAQELKAELDQVSSTLKQQTRLRTAGGSSRFEHLASQRRALLKELIQVDPDTATQYVLSSDARTEEFGTQANDPALFEEPVHIENAALQVIITMLSQTHANDGTAEGEAHSADVNMHSQVERFIEYTEANETRRFKAFACQSASSTQTNVAVNVTGYAVDDVLLLQEATPQRRRQTRQVASSWSTGAKTLLYIRVDFADLVGEPVSTATLTPVLNSLKSYWAESSYNQLTLASWTITPTVRVPQSASYYAVNYMQLLTDAKNAAAASGYNTANFNLFAVYFAKIANGWSGRGYVGAAGTWLNGNSQFYAIAHELGHNLGLWHSNFIVSSETPKVSYGGRGTNEEYGDYYDVMGRCYEVNCHYNLRNKMQLNWVPASSVTEVSTSGTFTLNAFDSARSAGTKMGLKLRLNSLDASRYYLVSYRSKTVSTNSLYSPNGALEVHAAYSVYNDVNSTHYIDTTAATTTRDPIVLNASWTSNTATPKYTVTLLSITCPANSACQASVRVTINGSSSSGGSSSGGSSSGGSSTTTQCPSPYVPCGSLCYVPAHQACTNGVITSIRAA